MFFFFKKKKEITKFINNMQLLQFIYLFLPFLLLLFVLLLFPAGLERYNKLCHMQKNKIG